MTTEELKNYYLLEGTIQDIKEKIAAIEAKLCGSRAFDTSGIPRNPTPKNRTEEAFVELAQLKSEIQGYESQKLRIERYITHIPDLLIRRITEKRVLENKSWKTIAKELGGRNTIESVKKMYYRYISDNSD